MAANLAGVRYPFSRVLLPRTRLAYVHLRNLLNDAKRDRAARVSGYVGIWLPDELVLLYLQHGEVVNATSTRSDGTRPLAIAAAIARVPAEPEYGEICFHEAEDELLACMYAAQTQPPDGWPAELRVTDPRVLFSYLMAVTFDGMIEIAAGGTMNYLRLTDGVVERAYLASSQGETLVDRVTSLFTRGARGELTVRRWPRPVPLPVQAPPALVAAYRELAAALVARVRATGRRDVDAVAERVRGSLVARHPALDTLSFVDAPPRDTVSDAGELTAAVASWIQEFVWAAADTAGAAPEQLLRDVMWERRHVYQRAGLLERIPWKVA